jgi:hypothetical protein
MALVKSTPDALRRLRNRNAVGRLDYLRMMRTLAGEMTQGDIAAAIRVKQPAISSALKTAAGVPDVEPGFSGGTPYEIAQRFDAGEISRDQLVDELARWNYSPDEPDDGQDWTTGRNSSFDGVTRAHRDDLIDDDTYEAILDRQDELGR